MIEGRKLKDVIVDWLKPCNKCGCLECSVKTRFNNRWLQEDDIATCSNCGKMGTIQTCDGYAWVVWDKGLL